MMFSRRSLLAAGGTAVALGAGRAVAAPAEAKLESALDRAAAAAIAAGACPGVAIEIWRDGRPLVAKAYGAANLETDAKVGPHSVFRVGSLTKQFTAALILTLAAEGRLGLDDPLSRHLPAFAKAEPVTLRQLLNQTAGLHSDEEDGSCAPEGRGARSQVQLAGEIAAQAKLFDFRPGTAWRYSNANYIVLGAVVEAVTATPLGEAARSRILQPLGLTRTAFDTSDAVVPGRVSGYTRADGKAAGFANAAYLEIAEAGGAGAMRSTTADLCKWHAALFSNRLFPAAYLNTMLAPGRLKDGRVSGANRFSPDDAAMGEVQYAMGLMVAPSAGGRRSIMHYGAINGFCAVLETFPEAGLTTAVLCNGDMGPDAPFRAIRRAVADTLPRAEG